jgi:copper chaperone
MMITITYTVPDISCEHCKQSIEEEVAQVEGVAAVEVDVQAKTVTVTGEVAEEAIISAIDEAGYEVAA